jgi:hypothetical protein
LQEIRAFVREANAPLEWIRRGFDSSDYYEFNLAFLSLCAMGDNSHVEFFDSVLWRCFNQKWAPAARKILLSFPRQWVEDHIEEKVAEILKCDRDRVSYSLAYTLYWELKPEFAIKLAREAINDADYDIRECAEDFLAEYS